MEERLRTFTGPEALGEEIAAITNKLVRGSRRASLSVFSVTESLSLKARRLTSEQSPAKVAIMQWHPATLGNIYISRLTESLPSVQPGRRVATPYLIAISSAAYRLKVRHQANAGQALARLPRRIEWATSSGVSRLQSGAATDLLAAGGTTIFRKYLIHLRRLGSLQLRRLCRLATHAISLPRLRASMYSEFELLLFNRIFLAS